MSRGGSRRGSGAPKGNFNALKHGYSSLRLLRGMAVLELSSDTMEVILAIKANLPSFTRDPDAARQRFLRTWREAQALGGAAATDPDLLRGLENVLAEYHPRDAWRPRRPDPARPWLDPVLAALLIAGGVAGEQGRVAVIMNLMATEALARAAAREQMQNAPKQKQSTDKADRAHPSGSWSRLSRGRPP